MREKPREGDAGPVLEAAHTGVPQAEAVLLELCKSRAHSTSAVPGVLGALGGSPCSGQARSPSCCCIPQSAAPTEGSHSCGTALWPAGPAAMPGPEQQPALAHHILVGIFQLRILHGCMKNKCGSITAMCWGEDGPGRELDCMEQAADVAE